uniref:Reverse transcriptase domain-containing protein n=1 Tax=Peronospora matthiolae TaxID=2874970 RepID=A0AAV1VNP9_9STRA
MDSSFTNKVFVDDPNSLLHRPTRGRCNGMLTMIRSDFPGFDTAMIVPSVAVPGRYLVVKLMVEDSPVYIHNVYAPVDRREKHQFFSQLDTAEFEDHATHLLGAVDAWRIHHDTKRVFTGPLPRRNRLDYILLSDDFCTRFYGDSKYFLPQHAGDHLAHSLLLHSGEQLHGQGYWKFPRYLLEYPVVVQAIEREADMVLEQLRIATNPGKVWEKWKVRIKRQLQDVQARLRQQNSQAVLEARSQLDRAASVYRVSAAVSDREIFNEALRNYKDIVTWESRHSQDKSFDFQVANSEKSTRHFFRPVDTTLRRVSIEEVDTPGGGVSKNPLEISLRFLEHWGSMMGDPCSPTGTAPPPDDVMQQKLLNSITRVVSDVDHAILNAPVTPTDLAAAIRHMKSTSAPGMDGLTAGFYQVAPDVFGACLSLVFNNRLLHGTLLPSQRKSAVVLLHKNGSRASPGNYRPISLVQVDVKVLSKALTYRLQHVIMDLIHPDQKGFVKGRSIHHHVRFLADLQNLVTAMDDDAYALFLDFEKAFDRVNWTYMFRLLERMGLGAEFLQWIHLLYHKPQAHLVINQNIQPALFPTRGVKQGDPLSALLFVLTIEPLGNLLRSHEEYGVCVSADHTCTSTFFADDSTLLGSSITNIQAQLELVDEYCRGSGAKLNLSKSVLLALNRNHDCPILPGVKVLGRMESVKYLGILVSQSCVNDETVEFLDQRFYDGFKAWYRRARTLRGRLLIAQTMVLSRLWHYTQHASISAAVVKRWQSMLNKFVLSRKHDRHASSVRLISQEFLYMRRSDGGLAIPNLEALLKRQHLQLLLQFITAATAKGERNWTTSGSEVLMLILPRTGNRHALDFLTISPLRHGEMINWRLTSHWWRVTWTWWYKIRWDITQRDLPSGDRVLYNLHQPIWYHSDPDLHFERATRSCTRQAHRRCIGMVPEPQRSFRLHIARVFRIRSLSDFVRSGSSWPSQTDFVSRLMDFTLLSTAPGLQIKWLRVLYKETTQIVERLNARSIVWPASPPLTQVAPYLGCTIGTKTFLVPAIPRTALLGVVWQPVMPAKPHPMTTHSRHVDDEQITSFIKHGKHLHKILLPVFEDLQFRVTFRLW